MAKRSLQQLLFIAIDKVFNPLQNGGKLDLNGVKVEYDIVYDENLPQYGKLDIYSPENATGKTPVLMYIHGGGFVAGDKHYRRYWCTQFAKMGYTVINVDYVLCPDFDVADCIFQAVHAVEWIEKVADERGWDLDLFIISGDSAGGYLSCETACIVNNPELHDVFKFKGNRKITNAILICGLYDLETLLGKKSKGIDLNSRLCYDMTKKNMDNMTEYEFFPYMLPAKLLNSNFPDSFLVYAEKDVFCAGQGEYLAQRLKELGKDVREFSSHRFFDNHCFNLNYKFKTSKKCNAQIYAYAQELLDKLAASKKD